MQYDWQADAACVGVGTDPFFPDESDPDPDLAQAQRLCESCHVQGACLEFALDNAEFGYWAGTTPKQRRSILRKRRAK